MSQGRLAEALGVSQPAVAIWEGSGRPDLSKALELQAMTAGAIPATAWGYTEEQVSRVLRAAKFPALVGATHTASDFTVAPAVSDAADDGPRVVRDEYTQVEG